MATESSLDPIFPLPAGTGIPPVKQGRGKDLFENDVHVSAGMTYRAFYVMWEQVENRAAHNYPRYVDGPLSRVAETWLEAVIWCRQIAHPNLQIEAISEAKARKIRAREARKAADEAKAKKSSKKSPSIKGADESACPECGSTVIHRKKRDGKPIWKCGSCKHRWARSSGKPSQPLAEPSKPRKRSSGSKAPGSKEPRPQKSKRGSKS